MTSADFLAYFPEFQEQNPTRIDLFITEAGKQLEEYDLGNRYEYALALLTAHMLAASQMSTAQASRGVSGPVTSIKGVDETVTFANLASQAGFQSTTYGQQLESIIARLPSLTGFTI